MKILWNTIKPFLYFALILIAVGCGVTIIKGYNQYYNALSKTPLEEKIEIIKQKDNYVSIKNVPADFKNAIIATEDHRFYKHFGLDITSTTRAVFENVKSMSLKEGGSTITQQLAKNLYFDQRKTLERKVAEVFVAFQLERNYNKDEILELYINTIYYGNGYYGIEEAASGYFNKDSKDLTAYEATLLVSFLKAPSFYSKEEYMKLAKDRQANIINKMVKYKYIGKKEGEVILNNQK